MMAALAAGIGIVCGQNTANAFAAAYYPTYIRATGVGWALGIGRIGAIIGPGLGGLMLALQWSRQALLLATAVPELIASAAILVLMLRELAHARLASNNGYPPLPHEMPRLSRRCLMHGEWAAIKWMSRSGRALR